MADFSYFDQFTDIQVDLTEYLLTLSTSGIPYRFDSNQPVVTNIKNLFTHYEVVIEFKKNIDAILHFNINEGQTVEQVSYEQYGSTDYWWIVYVFNNIKNPFLEWPFTQEQIKELATLLYTEEGKYAFNTYCNFLQEDNEKKRNIIIPQPYSLKDFIWSYRQQILNI